MQRRSYTWLLLGVGLVILTVGILSLRYRLQSERLESEALPIIGEVGQFSLTNQLGQAYSEERLRGRIWVGDIIFTRCPGPCTLMTRHLASLQSRLSARDSVQLISLTADPQHDTPENLKEYGARFGADPARWQFLTGEKSELYRLALDDLKLAAEEVDPVQRENMNDLYVHSTRFVLVDGQGRVRGYFDGTDEKVTGRLAAAIRRLQREN